MEEHKQTSGSHVHHAVKHSEQRKEGTQHAAHPPRESHAQHQSQSEQHRHHHPHKHPHKKESASGFTFLAYGFFVVIGLLLIYNFMQLSAVGDLLEERLAEAEAAAVPAIISLTTITDASCRDCFDLDPLVKRIEGAHVNITERLFLDLETGAALLERYGIEKVPTIIVTGELNKSGISGLDEIEDALVLTQVEAPYVEVASGKTQGLVSVVHVFDSACDVCVDLSASIEELKGSFAITHVDTYDRSSLKAKAAIATYGITQLPALILSSAYNVYPSASDLEAVGEIASDQSLVIATLQPPYVDAGTGKIEGVVDWIMLTDSSCSSCYDVTMHRAILARFGFAFGKKETFDISSARGRELVEKYGITSVPAIIVSKDAKSYEAFTQVWGQVGTEERDGVFVFRNNDILGQTYKDLKTNVVIEGGSAQ